ncbi:MAG TPA: hypothetical protein VGR35_03060 [Tepidisphaeraceae bacterium]|nr:hypothetical protein [Tepidisphaeraceae bacterium]
MTPATQPAAEAVGTTVTQAVNPAWFSPTVQWPGQTDLITWCNQMGPALATILLIGGVVYLVFGVYMYKALITINLAVVGAYLGAFIGFKTGGRAAMIPWALIGGFTFAAMTWPLMKYAVALMGGLYGFLLGAAIWHTAALEAKYAWAGGGMGLIAFGMLSFILFRGSIMMYTSLQGSVMLVFGLLGLIFKYQSVTPKLIASLTSQPILLPLSIFIPTVLGLIYQQTQFGAADGGPAKK